MPSYVELQRSRHAEGGERIALPDDVVRAIAFRLDGEWVAALHNALTSHCPRGGERFVEALGAGGYAAAVLFEVPARSEGEPPIHVVRWTDETAPRTEAARSSSRQLRLPKPSVV